MKHEPLTEMLARWRRGFNPNPRCPSFEDELIEELVTTLEAVIQAGTNFGGCLNFHTCLSTREEICVYEWNELVDPLIEGLKEGKNEV